MKETKNIASVNKIISNLSLEEKLSQLFIVGYFGTTIHKELLDWVSSGLGGLVLFRDNITDTKQVAKQIYNFQNNSKVGLFVAIDQEGGLVERIKGATQIPTAMALASIGDNYSLSLANNIIAEELNLLGFNMNYSPVLDVNTEPMNPVIGVRSFGENANKVATHALTVIESMRSKNIVPVAKHFPGHGASTLDSHLGLPIINISDNELDNIHIFPYKDAIKNNIEMIMVCHVYFPQQEEETGIPSSLSKSIITGLLKEKLNYNGLIITDDLDMKAISNMFSIEQAAFKAISAGVDVLLYRNYKNARKAYSFILNEAKANEDLESKINESLRKLLDLKFKYSILNNDYKFDELSISNKIGTKEKHELIQNVFDKSITIYKDFDGRKNILKEDSIIIISVNKNSLTHYQNEPPLLLRDLINNNVKELCISLNPTNEEMEFIKKQLDNYNKVIIISYNAQFNTNQAKLFKDIIDSKEAYVLVAGTPYDIRLFSKAKFIALSYCYANSSISAFFKILTLKISKSSKLPVRLPL